MGNHAIGRAMVAVAEVAYERRREGETALDILDEAAKRSEVNGMDAEFDDAPYEDGPFRSLLIEAFAPGKDFSDDEDGDDFYEEVWDKLRIRYNLC